MPSLLILREVMKDIVDGFLRFFELNEKRLIAIVLAIVLYLFIVSNGGLLVLQDSFPGAKFAEYYVEPLLFLFLLISCFLLISGFCRVLSLSCQVIKSVFASLARRYQVWRTAYDASQLTKRRYADVIAALSPEEKTFLELFCADGAALQRMSSETLLPHKIYIAHNYLIKKGLIKTDYVHKKRYGPPRHY